MEENTWYLYQNGQQIGPFDTQHVSDMFRNGMVSQEGYLFKMGWKEWRPIKDGYKELGLEEVAQESAGAEESDQRRQMAPRATLSGRVVVHNDGHLSIGRGVNISSTGIFVEAREQMFAVGERLKISARCSGIKKAFNAFVRVIRFNSHPDFPQGYGLKFEGLDENVREGIKHLVDEQDIKEDKVLRAN